MFYAVPFVSNTHSLKNNYYHGYSKYYKFNYKMMRVLKTHIMCALIHLKFFHSLKCVENLQRARPSAKLKYLEGLLVQIKQILVHGAHGL